MESTRSGKAALTSFICISSSLYLFLNFSSSWSPRPSSNTSANFCPSRQTNREKKNKMEGRVHVKTWSWFKVTMGACTGANYHPREGYDRCTLYSTSETDTHVASLPLTTRTDHVQIMIQWIMALLQFRLPRVRTSTRSPRLRSSGTREYAIVNHSSIHHGQPLGSHPRRPPEGKTNDDYVKCELRQYSRLPEDSLSATTSSSPIFEYEAHVRVRLLHMPYTALVNYQDFI